LLVAAGQAQLVADEPLAGGDLRRDEELLCTVGGGHVDVGVVRAELDQETGMPTELTEST
jgi:hypothetical protein